MRDGPETDASFLALVSGACVIGITVKSKASDTFTFIMRSSVLKAMRTIMRYSNVVDTTTFQMRYLMEFLFLGA